MAADKAFAYLGVGARLVGMLRSRRQAAPGSVAVQLSRQRPAPCLAAEKAHIVKASRDITGKVRYHKYFVGLKGNAHGGRMSKKEFFLCYILEK